MAGEPDGTTLMGGDNNPNPNNPDPNATPTAPTWMAQLPDDLKTNETLAGFATIGDVGKSFLDLHGKLDGSVKIPGEEATAEEKSSFFNALGRPESPDKYEFTKPELPTGIEYDDAQEADFRKMAHELGMSQAQAVAMYNYYHDQVKQSHNAYHESVANAKTEAEEALKKEWGTKYDGNLEVAVRAVRDFGGEEVLQFLETSGLGNNPIIVKLFNRIGSKLMEDNLESGNVDRSEERPRSLSGHPMLDFPSMDKD